MIGSFKKAMIALTMGATLAGVAASPADAQRYNHNRGGHHRGVSTGTALGIGVLGLGLGLALSDGGGYYDYRGGYDYYAPPPRYVAPPRYYRDCWNERYWDNYYRSWMVRQVCR